MSGWGLADLPDQRGRTAIVTGGNSGLGAETVRALANAGARVLLACRDRTKGEAVARAVGGVVEVRELDLASLDSLRAFAAALDGPVDLLINNAGVPGPFGPIWEVDAAEWWRAQAIHIRAPMLFMQRVLPGMVARDRGRIICVSAIASRIVAPHLSAYCTGKIAQNRLVAEAAAELAGYKVAAFAIDPGFAATQLARDTAADPEARRYFKPLIERIENQPHAYGTDPDLARCAQRCADLASGRYDALSGGYFELDDDLDAALGKLSQPPGQ